RTPDDLRAGRDMIQKSLTIDPHGMRSNVLKRLTALGAAMYYGGEEPALDEAIPFLQKAIADASPHDPALPEAQDALGSLLLTRYTIHGLDADGDAVTEILDA